MANDTDTEDVEAPDTSADMDVEGSPEAGFSTGNGSGMGMAQPAQPTVGPMAQQPAAGGGGGLAGNIQSLLQGGLTGGPNVGPMVQQRHGGLLTGLAGVLLDGLASGMAPDAETAARMPMIRQQQAMQQQQMQLQQQKMQEEMKLAPVREKLLLAQAQMQFMQLDHAMMEMTTQNQAGLTDFYRDFVGKKIASNAAEEVATGSLDDAKAYQREHAHDPDGMQLFLWPKERDAQGNITKASVVKILPDAWSPAVKYEHDYTSPVTGKKYAIKVDSPAGPAGVQSVDVGKQLTTQYADVGTDDQAAKTPQQGLMQAIKQAQQAGKSGQAVFDDPNVQTAVQAVRATQKPGGGFESEAYGQYAEGEQAKGRQPLSMRDFHAKLWPQTQIAFAGLAIKEKGPEKQQDIADYLTANNLPDTAVNREAARNVIAGRLHGITEAAKTAKANQDILNQVAESRQFAAQPSPTNDFALLMNFVGITKPESVGKLRFNQNELRTVLGTRSALGNVEALGNRIANGEMLTADQRKQMLATMGVIESRAAGVPAGAKAGRDATGKIVGYFDGAKWVPLP